MVTMWHLSSSKSARGTLFEENWTYFVFFFWSKIRQILPFWRCQFGGNRPKFSDFLSNYDAKINKKQNLFQKPLKSSMY